MPLTPTARTPPTGRRIPEGFRSLITFKSKPAIQFWEIEVQPSGVKAGEMINIVTQFNTKLVTKFPRALVERTDIKTTVGYDPDVIDDIVALAGVPDEITTLYPDNTTEVQWGALTDWDPKSLKIGDFPTADITIGIMSCNPTTLAEDGGAITEAVGT
jgi:hypothetical protein